MPPTVSATDVAAITAAVLEKLRQDVTSAVTQALGQRQGNGVPSRRSRSESLGERQRREQPPTVSKDTDTPPSGRSRSRGAQQRTGSPRAQQTRGTMPAKVKAKPGMATTESALLATIEELRGTIRDLRKEIAALRNAGGSQQPQEAGARQKERRAREEEKKDATQRTQLAQPQQTYASAVQTSTRRGRAHTVVIAKKEPQAAGIPLQPVAEELQRTAEKGGYGAVLPARPYRDRDLVDTGMTQLAPSSTPAQWPTTLKKLLVVGKTTEDAWALASEALMAHKSLQEVAAIVNVGRPGAAPAIDTLLRSVGWSKEELALTGAHLSVTATSRSSQWEPVDPGPAVWPPGYRLLLRWSTKETLEDKAPQPLAAVVTAGTAGMARLYCSLDKLEVADGLPPNRTKADATRWGCRGAWDHLKEIV